MYSVTPPPPNLSTRLFKVLDIGCGDSYFDRVLLQSVSNIEICGVDVFLKDEELVDEERYRTVNNLDSISGEGINLILMMDVLEHIENDMQYLQAITDRLADDGTVFITVPAFEHLFSAHDEELHHYRRYNHKRLHTIIEAAGLKEVKWSYFYFSLILPRLATMNAREVTNNWGRSKEDFVTRSIVRVLNADFAVLCALSKIGLHLPGLSLMSICKKK